MKQKKKSIIEIDFAKCNESKMEIISVMWNF